jgi:hypothetical protein
MTNREMQEYYALWDRMMDKPMSFNVAIIHYTTLIGMLNDGFELRVGREEFRPLINIPEEYRKLIIDKYDEQN